MQSEMLKLIHGSHLGITRSLSRARDILYWPGMSSQIQDVVSTCGICNTYQRKIQKEPLIPHSVPDRPWSKLGVDIFELQGKQYLVIVDYYSGFDELDLLTHLTANQVINYCKSQFSRHGIPDVLISDNGPQFRSDSIGSPAQRLMGRRTKTLLPISSALLKPKTINPKAV